jgi:hypothetical protein
MGVFGRGDDECVARADERAQRLDRLGLRPVFDIVVGVEERQLGEIAVAEHLDALGRQQRQRLQRRRVGGSAAQASGDGEHSNRRFRPRNGLRHGR